MEAKERTTMGDDIATTLRILRLQQAFCPKLIPTLICSVITNVAIPFINIVLPAQILDCLLGDRDAAELPRLILLTVGLNLLFGMLRLVLDQVRTLHDAHVEQMQDHLKLEKFLRMDYEHAENPESQDYISRAEEGFSIVGRSTEHIRDAGSLLQGMITLAVALAIAAPLLLSAQATVNTSGFGFVSSPLAPLYLFLLLIGTAALGMHLNEQSQREVYEETQDMVQINRLFRYIIRLLGNYRYGMEIRLFNLGPLIAEQSERQHHYIESYWQRVQQRTLKPSSLIAAIQTATTGVIYLYVAMQALGGAIPISGILLYSAAIFQLNGSLTSLTQIISSMRGRCLYLKLFLDFLDLPDVKPQGKLAVPHALDGRYEIEFRNVSFRYSGSADYALRHVSLRLEAGKTLAVVGMNGAGKTTFIKLLCRLYDPTEGEILYNGIDIRELDYQGYMQLFGVVYQDFKLLPLTVGENVAASAEYNTERVCSALRLAGIEERVLAMPHQLRQYLYKLFNAEEGIEISGGEAQKIAIARAIYKDATFVILDEPTAALDPIAEYEVYSHFAEMVGNRSSVFISHRLASCRFCQEIAVFHQGSKIQRGSHDELLSDASGKYAELWQAQAQYYHPNTVKADL